MIAVPDVATVAGVPARVSPWRKSYATGLLRNARDLVSTCFPVACPAICR
jgi:hypothetical protein